jgi:hypothetical protein
MMIGAGKPGGKVAPYVGWIRLEITLVEKEQMGEIVTRQKWWDRS